MSLKNEKIFSSLSHLVEHYNDHGGKIQTFYYISPHLKSKHGASLVAQWLRIRLPMQGTQVRALVREDLTCRRATKPVRHNYWAYVLEPVSHNYWAHVPQLLKVTHLEPMFRNKRSHCNEKPAHLNKEQPPLPATRESPYAATKTQRSQKFQINYFF